MGAEELRLQSSSLGQFHPVGTNRPLAQFRGRIGGAEHLAGDARSRENGEHESRALLAHHAKDGASHIHRAEQERLDLIANLSGA
jgi:hypothetical protein